MSIGAWFPGPLRCRAVVLLKPALMQLKGYLRPEPIQIIWRYHLNGCCNPSVRLWTVLMWAAWLAEWG